MKKENYKPLPFGLIIADSAISGQGVFTTRRLVQGTLLGISHYRLDGEYIRALKTMGGSGISWVDALFRFCVVLLVNMAKVIGISYEEINIWIFVIIQPVLIVFLFLWVLRLRRSIKRLKRS